MKIFQVPLSFFKRKREKKKISGEFLLLNYLWYVIDDSDACWWVKGVGGKKNEYNILKISMTCWKKKKKIMIIEGIFMNNDFVLVRVKKNEKKKGKIKGGWYSRQ